MATGERFLGVVRTRALAQPEWTKVCKREPSVGDWMIWSEAPTDATSVDAPGTVCTELLRTVCHPHEHATAVKSLLD